MVDSVVDAVSSGQAAGVGSITVSHTCASQSNALIVVSQVETDTGVGGQAVTGITYNSVALTKITSRTTTAGTDTESAEIWYLINPSSGANNIVVTYTGTIDSCIAGGISIVYAQVDNPVDSSNTGIGTTSPSTTSTTTVRGWTIVIGVMNGSGSTTVLTSVAGQSLIYKVTNTGHFRGAADYKIQSGAASSSIGWTFTNETWVNCVCSIALTLPPELYQSQRTILRTL